ncbi:MAG: GAF domain-containing protein, partial [Proteobacteria bacterium]|nr:GAF domain-containing protein [Pseudomonadota bacterium]
MMRRQIGIYGASDETLRLIPLLTANPEVEIARVYDADRPAALTRARAVDPALPSELEPLLTDDAAAFLGSGDLHGVIDAGMGPAFTERFPAAAERGTQIVTPLTARLLWGYGVAARDRKGELLQALSEIVESVELTIHSAELFSRMLEIAVGATGADGGSLMLLDAESRELRISVAIGVEPELWPKIRVPLGEGIAGRAAADGRPVLLRGKADRQAFHIMHERLDVESALCVPLIHDGQVLGVLNLHHTTRPDTFSQDDLEFMEQLARLDGQIIARAQEHESLRNQAARYTAVREVRGILTGRDPHPERLRRLCRFIADRVGGGIVNLYLRDADENDLLLAATSLKGGGFGGEYRVVPGQGIDGRVAKTGRPAFLRGENGALAYVALPMMAGDRLLGVLSMQAGSEPPSDRAAEETLLEIAAAVAEGVAQTERENRMTARATRIGAINETGIRMISATEVSQVVRLATSSGAMILEADHAVLRMRNEETGRYSIRSYFGPADGPVQERLFRLDKRVSVAAIKRRSVILVRDLATHAAFAEGAGDFRSLMVAPLKREGQVVGTLALYDKVAADRFYAGRFNDDDLQIFTRFVSYVERAVVNCLFHAGVRAHKSFDDETGLPNLDYLQKRIHEEITRAVGREGSLAVVVCRIENLEEIRRQASPSHGHRVVLRAAEALGAFLRDFDVLGRTEDSEFTVLMPDPGLSPGERVFALARAVADAIAKDDRLNDPVRVALAFGYAVHPGDGA